MKKIATVGLFLIIIGIGLYYKDTIVSFMNKYTVIFNKDPKLKDFNKYYRDYDFEFVQNTTNFRPNNRQELLNVYYTILNSGVDQFTFFCGDEYDNCINDVKELAQDQTILSDINNYVHPFNSFKNVETEYDDTGKVTFKVYKMYTKEQIVQINNHMKVLTRELIYSNDSQYNNILRAHDYIINHTEYDSDKAEGYGSNYSSDTAYGPLYEGYAICGGYTDLMQLFLEEMGIKNFRVSSDMHVWNAVYINDNWVNLDLTWDDPVISDGSEILDHKFFLIDTYTLHSIENTEHNFDYNSYPELKEA